MKGFRRGTPLNPYIIIIYVCKWPNPRRREGGYLSKPTCNPVACDVSPRSVARRNPLGAQLHADDRRGTRSRVHSSVPATTPVPRRAETRRRHGVYGPREGARFAGGDSRSAAPPTTRRPIRAGRGELGCPARDRRDAVVRAQKDIQCESPTTRSAPRPIPPVDARVRWRVPRRRAGRTAEVSQNLTSPRRDLG